MTAPHTQMYVHLVWGTWKRLPIVTDDLEPRLYAQIASKCHELKCRSIAIGGMPDHIHILVELHPTVAVADLVRLIKGASAHFANHVANPGGTFRWQGSYAAFTLRKNDIDGLVHYIRNQKQHHRAANGVRPDWEQM